MRRRWPLVLASTVTAGALHAGPAQANEPRADIWVCTDPATGAKTYTSRPRDARDCRSTDQAAGTSRAAAPAASVARPAARTASTPATVTAETRKRDTDRKQILRDELEAENRKLAELQREFNLGAPIRRPDETDNAKFLERKLRLTNELERSRINVRTLERELERL